MKSIYGHMLRSIWISMSEHAPATRRLYFIRPGSKSSQTVNRSQW